MRRYRVSLIHREGEKEKVGQYVCVCVCEREREREKSILQDGSRAYFRNWPSQSVPCCFFHLSLSLKFTTRQNNLSSMTLLFYYLAPLQNDTDVTSRCMQFIFGDMWEATYLIREWPVTEREGKGEGKKSIGPWTKYDIY